MQENIFEWHFCIRGAYETEFERGIYHGRILMPADYPFKPPAFVMLTPSGRFETGVKICLSISSHHPESWQPSWSVRSALIALVAFMQTPGNGAVGSLDHSPSIRRQMAAEAHANPPKHSNPERQELINSMHEKMIELESRSYALFLRQKNEPCSAEMEAVEERKMNDEAKENDVSKQDTSDKDSNIKEETSHVADQTAGEVSTQESSQKYEDREGESNSKQGVKADGKLIQETSEIMEPQDDIGNEASNARLSPSVEYQEQRGTVIARTEFQETWEDRLLTYISLFLACCILFVLGKRIIVNLTSSGHSSFITEDTVIFSSDMKMPGVPNDNAEL